ncbi:hypothetical protein FPE01S_01_11630 [Flavihumibacter petaseus NBRC 106054]|uniref:Fibronectin type-III domain-containing protein n=1 Tax=Flavihumibacter petaseus NBRC 106054 TaxID=1220578 RepID=A0A0E9MYE3_9BACT|nr:hypothetical protein FPE01S_01_11630 [Flavihumibacter petaseus NBRC 106054]
MSAPGKNSLKVKVAIHSDDTLALAVRYWPKGSRDSVTETAFSATSESPSQVLTNLQPGRTYAYQLVTRRGTCTSAGKEYEFKSQQLPLWAQDQFRLVCPDPGILPAAFRDGYFLVYRRDLPGLIYLLDAKGNIRWYHQVNGTGVKMATFTPQQTILALLGDETYQTSYGNELLEINLSGDTLLHLKKGRDFQQTLHHEVLPYKDRLITISSEEKVMNLSKRGGGKADTVKTDGILVMDRSGKTLWHWTIFDVLDPLQDPAIAKEKSDWMHANSLQVDKDGNYLLSFYNNGQIWKIDAQSGKVIWKFGKGGDYTLAGGDWFDNSHAAHINAQGNLMLFDNGTKRLQSHVLSYRLDEATKVATLAFDVPLPKDVYSERMGSAYLINDTTVLSTCTKRNTVVLTNLQGRFLWALRSNASPYRVEFIPKEKLFPFLTH